MKTIALANLKGGVGKTVLTMNLGITLSRKYKTLLIDTDSQGSLSSGFRVNDGAMARVMGGEPLGDNLVKVRDNLFLCPSDLSLSKAELQLVSKMGRESVLRNALHTVSGRFDLCLIDTPPSFGLMAVNALNAADGVIVPVKPEGADLKGLVYFYDTLEELKQALNPGLDILGIVLTFFDERLNHHRAGLKAIERAERFEVLATVGRTIRISEAYTAGKALFEYSPKNKNVKNIELLSREVELWVTK